MVEQIDFGTAIVDLFGFSTRPTHKVVVKNHSSAVVMVEVTGDRSGDLLPLFGPTEVDLAPAPQNAFELQPTGQSGDMMMGWVGLELLTPTSGARVTTITFRATATVPPRVAVECKTESRNCENNAESAFKIEEVIEASGAGIADVVDGSQIDTPGELANYAVVVIGGSGRGGDTDYGVFQSALKQWVQSGGGVVATGWTLWHLGVDGFTSGDLESILPLGWSTASKSTGDITKNQTVHPVTIGVSDFVTPHHVNWGPLKQGATVLATDHLGDPAVVVWTVGQGRVVYLSPIYFASYRSYTNEPLLDGSIPNAVKLFLQAVEWAAGFGPAAAEGLSQPAIAGSE